MPKRNGIGRRIIRIQTADVNEIACKQIPARFFKKATMSGRMPRRVQDRQRPVSKFQPIAVMQKTLRFPMKNTVGSYVNPRRKVARFPRKTAPDGRERERKIFQPRRFRLMNGEGFKLTKPANVIQMRMRKDDDNRKICQPADDLPDIFHSQARVDQNGTLASAKQVTKCLFPMLRFADHIGICVDLLDGKPIRHSPSPRNKRRCVRRRFSLRSLIFPEYTRRSPWRQPCPRPWRE